MSGAPCQECGMACETGEYHPYAACLMFKACRDRAAVRANLSAVRESAPATSRTLSAEHSRLKGNLKKGIFGVFESLVAEGCAGPLHTIEGSVLAAVDRIVPEPAAGSERPLCVTCGSPEWPEKVTDKGECRKCCGELLFVWEGRED